MNTNSGPISHHLLCLLSVLTTSVPLLLTRLCLDLMTMPSESSDLEKRLQHLLVQFQIEAGVFERMVYKNKNQHRRGSYFQYLLKVRRDVRILQSAGLGEILKALFPIINGKRPAQKAFYPTRSKSNSSGAKHNCQDRLLGVARLLSQITEPLLKAATQISLLLAKSFFTGFCITILALLARFRVLVQQMLLDVVLIFNKVSSLTREKQSVKLSQDGIEAFREYYPSTEKVLMLDCLWREDKFLLVERTENKDSDNRDEDLKAVPFTTSIQYETLEFFNEATQHENICSPSVEPDTSILKDQRDAVPNIENTVDSEDPKPLEEKKFLSAVPEETSTGSFLSSTQESQTESRIKVAFVSVKRSNSSDTNMSELSKKVKLDLGSCSSTETEDPFLSLLFSGRTKSSVL